MAALSPQVVVAVDGYLPGVVDRALGSVRFRVRFLALGGTPGGTGEALTPSSPWPRGFTASRAFFGGKGGRASTPPPSRGARR